MALPRNINLLKMQDSLKNLSDDEIKNQLANPTGDAFVFVGGGAGSPRSYACGERGPAE